MSALGEREHGEGLVASHVRVTNRSGDVIVNDVSVNARAGRTLVIVGESGAGKSMLARTLCALTPSVLHASGTVSIGGKEYDLAADHKRQTDDSRTQREQSRACGPSSRSLDRCRTRCERRSFLSA